MNSIIIAIKRMGSTVVHEVSQFDPIAWGVVSVCTVVFGFMLLRGNVLK